ncbi:uncharacterized protein LOC135486058 [Lineus longissimus]|uniref:uncharacterized protein LOC135486058 n=1 Tax=Lineus longissimus TaxID=88925 RepID=UPI00315C57CE
MGKLDIATISSEVSCKSQKAELVIESLAEDFRRKIEVWTMPEMCTNLRVLNWNHLKKSYGHLSGIQFPTNPGGKNVDMVLGSDYPELGICLEERQGNPGEPIARRTPLGWTCVGKVKTGRARIGNNLCTSLRSVTRPSQIDEEMRALWNQDLIENPDVDNFSPDEKKAIAKTKESLRYVGDRFEVGIPWKREKPNLPDNRSMAEKRLRSLEASFRRRPEVGEQYKNAFNQNIEKGYVRKLSPEEASEKGWYLPHFAIVKKDKETTKVRIVYDAAAMFEGTSLNDEMLPGPNLRNDIVKILLNFRRRPVALVGDVKEMFNQLVLKPDHSTRYHRLLWRDLQLDRPIDTYEAVRVVFGDRASPYLAMFVLREQADRESKKYPVASQVIKSSTCMDDIIDNQLVLKPDHSTRYHRLLWRDLQLDRPIDTYEAVRVVFGDRASPYLAMFVLREQADRESKKYPVASQVIKSSTCMDDIIDSFETTKVAREIREDLQTVVKPAGFDIMGKQPD